MGDGADDCYNNALKQEMEAVIHACNICRKIDVLYYCGECNNYFCEECSKHKCKGEKMTEKKTKAIAKVDSNVQVAQWDDEKWAKIKKMFLPTCKNDLDVEIFMELAKGYDLNPFKKEIWAIPFKKWNPETKQKEDSLQVFCARDGFLSIAHKTGMFNGMETQYGYGKNGNLLWAETIVYNKSCEHPIKCKVFLNEYSSGMNLWKTKPHVMLQKVAESTALRRAFNISGLYSPEEFKEEGSSNNSTNTNTPKQRPASLPEPQRQVEDVAKQLDAAIINDNDGLQRGNFDVALRNIEGCWDIEKLARLQKALNKRQWTPEEAKFLIDAVGKQEEKIVSQSKEDE